MSFIWKFFGRKPTQKSPKRVQSMSSIPQKIIDPDFVAFERECQVLEEQRINWMDTRDYQGLERRKPPRQMKRRVQSAPLLYDPVYEDEDFLVPVVQEQAKRTLENKTPVEQWDDDFETEIQLPSHLDQQQLQLKMDMEHLKKFDLHVKDLKLLHEQVLKAIENVPEAGCLDASDLEVEYQPMMETVQVLLDFSSFKDDGKDEKITKDHLKVLERLLKDTHEAQNFSKMVEREQIYFGHVLLDVLLLEMMPLKQELQNYKQKLESIKD